jgi:hypothetical protein
VSQQSLPIADRHVRLSRADRIKAVCRGIAEAKGFEAIARELDNTFAKEGRHVSSGLLHNTLDDNERNYLRAEWLPVFLEYDETDAIAQLCADVRGKVLTPIKRLTAEDKLQIIEEILVREYGAAGARIVASVEGPQRGSRR